MRNIKIAPGEYYHIFNRGMSKQKIFFDRRDWFRFLFLIIYFQSPTTFQNVGRLVTEFVQHSVLNNKDNVLKIIRNRHVELVSFCLMPNHFHLIIKEVEEGGISSYMQRVLNSYAKYFNKKYEKSGHLLQGPYKAVHISDNRQLVHVSAYIHKNPRELEGWKNKEHQYTWSSYQDYIGENRWPNLLVSDIITGQFKNKKEYGEFVQTSTAKMLEEELEYVPFI